MHLHLENVVLLVFVLVEVVFCTPTRIVGGQYADILDFPYQLSLQFKGHHICGASVIKSDMAITAAHCVNGSDPKNLNIYAGSSNLFYGGIKRSVSKYICNPNYNEKTVDYDVALLELEGYLPFSPAIQPISLPRIMESIPTGTFAVVTGWGATNENGTGSRDLMKVFVPVLPQWKCRLLYLGITKITPRMLCAGYTQGEMDSCQGDSGGPLVANGKLIGIVSWGIGCARPRAPGVYTNVARLILWIRKTANMPSSGRGYSGESRLWPVVILIMFCLGTTLL